MGDGNKGLHINTRISGRGPRLQALKPDPQLEAITSKLVTGILPPARDYKGRRQVHTPDPGYLEAISNKAAQNINDADSLFQLLPDMELAKQIMISSILSPHDMVSTELLFSVEGQDAEAEMDGKLKVLVETYFENTYKIKKLLAPMLEAALFKEGSYPIAILPESSIDHAINGEGAVGMESIEELDSKGRMRPLGILGMSKVDSKAEPSRNESVISTESFATNSYKVQVERSNTAIVDEKFLLEAEDNPSILKIPMLKRRLSAEKIAARFDVGKLSLESYRRSKSSDNGNAAKEYEMEQSLYRTRHYNHVPIMPVVDMGEENVGHPLAMHLPHECVIPVFVPGDPENHVGYFVMLDMTGNPVSKTNQADYYANIASNLSNGDNQVSRLLNMTEKMQNGPEDSRKQQMVETAIQNYTDMVEADLLHRLTNGIYGDGEVEIARPQEVYRIMLARALQKQQTRLLYVPDSLMTYIAFDYNEFGMGKSLVESTKIIGSIRAMLLFANTMAQIKNSVGQTVMNIELDPEDPDPTQTIEEIIHEYSRVKGRTYPIGRSNPMEIVDYLQSAGTQVAITGHPGYPETKVDIEDRSQSRTTIDMDLDEALKRRHISAWGLSPETVDLSMDVDFATSIVASNINLTKRVKVYQDIFCMHLKDFIAKYTMKSGALVQKMRDLIVKTHEDKDNVDPDKIIMSFLERLVVSLPSPDSVKLENQLQAYQSYSEALEMALEAYVNEDMLDMGIVGDASDAVPATMAALRGYFKRQWLRNNNVLPELEVLVYATEKEEERFNLLDLSKDHVKQLMESLQDFMVDWVKQKKESDKAIDEVENPPEPEEEEQQ